MDRAQILSELRRCAAENGGRALGRAAFERETGIKEAWVNRYWVRWNDAVAEAGLPTNTMNVAYSDEYILGRLAELTRELGHYPVANELLHKAARSTGFPDPKTFQRLGRKAVAKRRLVDFCAERPDLADIVALVDGVIGGETSEIDSLRPSNPVGYVYLVRSGKHYKIGQTNNLVRRTNEIRIQLPEHMEMVHQISTDDPLGIERYWHSRFADLRANGEWFALKASDVAIFRKRRFM